MRGLYGARRLYRPAERLPHHARLVDAHVTGKELLDLRFVDRHIAAKVLEQLGYTNVAVYAGGKQDWQEAGLALEREAVQAA